MIKVSLFILLSMINLTPLTGNAQNTSPIVAGKNGPIVQTEKGKVRGYIHNGVFTFKGIPYGEAKRFMAPEKTLSWQGVRSSMSYGPVCPNNQTPSFNDEIEFAFHRNRGYYNSEDCLNLNIWTNSISTPKKKPVMVWLHGGGFSSGSAVEFPSYDGENLSRKDVVVVSINHRLNVLGFIDLSAYGEKYKYSANAGAMDMVAALRWIKENISTFGGDPDNVTIFGQSGGGAKVTCLLNTPSAKGLFHKAIIQSGSYLNRFITKSISQKVSAAVLEELKIQPDQVDSLETIPYNVLDAAGQKALAKVNATLKPEEMPAFGLEWEPVLDGEFLPYQPNEGTAMELSKNIPLLVGSVKNEYTPFDSDVNDAMEKVNAQLKEKYRDRVPEYLAAMKKAYPETNIPSDYIDIDFIFRPFVIKQANQKSALQAAPVYTYLFAWQSPAMDGAYKAFHCMDLPFVFNNIQRCEEMTGGGKDAYILADKVSEAWVQFAKTGNPGHNKLPDWPAYNSENGATMIFDTKCQIKNHHDKELMMIGSGK